MKNRVSVILPTEKPRTIGHGGSEKGRSTYNWTERSLTWLYVFSLLHRAGYKGRKVATTVAFSRVTNKLFTDFSDETGKTREDFTSAICSRISHVVNYTDEERKLNDLSAAQTTRGATLFRRLLLELVHHQKLPLGEGFGSNAKEKTRDNKTVRVFETPAKDAPKNLGPTKVRSKIKHT